MTRFTRILMAVLVVLACVPAQAGDQPVRIYSEFNANGTCSSLRCFGMELLRQVACFLKSGPP